VPPVDPGDDVVTRFVVRRYAYDPARDERRHQVVAAFDNEREFMGLMRLLQDELDRRRAAGDPVDPREHLTGIILEPGYHRRQRERRRSLRAATTRPANRPDPLQPGD